MKYEEAKETLVAAMKLKQYSADTQKKFVTSLTYICEYHSKYKCVEAGTGKAGIDFLLYGYIPDAVAENDCCC